MKGKVVPVLNSAPRHEDVWNNEGIVPILLKLGTKRRPAALSEGKELPIRIFHKRLRESHEPVWALRSRQTSLASVHNRTAISRSFSLVTIPTILYWLAEIITYNDTRGSGGGRYEYSCLLKWVNMYPEEGGSKFLRNVGTLSAKLHSITYQTTVKSNLTTTASRTHKMVWHTLASQTFTKINWNTFQTKHNQTFITTVQCGGLTA